MAKEFTLAGNSGEVFQKIQDKKYFFALLNRLNIDYPLTIFNQPQSSSGWLMKPMNGEGGVGIQRDFKSNSTAYWQRYIEGIAGSVLFLSDGKNSRVVGFHTQSCTSLGPEAQFIFSGINNLSPLTQDQERRVAQWVQVLVPEFSLRGLNSLDFIVTGEHIRVLEVNPRISASLQLYEPDLLIGHLHACERKLRSHFANDFRYCGFRILYADATIEIKDGFNWPEGCMDIPLAGSIIRKGQPICSIIARNECSHSVFERLAEQQKIIEYQLKRGQ